MARISRVEAGEVTTRRCSASAAVGTGMLVTLVSGALGPTAVAAAAEAAPAEPDALQEVVVTAQRRAENLQNVPVSVQVVDGEKIQGQNLNSLETLAETVPSVHIASSARSSDMYIRGTGSGQNQAFDQSVGTFIDDVYHGRSRTSAGTFLDLDRVEVLKGPQSTFFGNNAIAGALNIVTKKPDGTTDGWARALYGQYGQYAVEGAAGAPIGAVFSVRGAFTFNGEDGWQKNVFTGDHSPENQNISGRLSFGFKPNDDLSAVLKLEAAENKNKTGFANQVGNCPPAAPFVAQGFCTVAISLGIPTGIDNHEYSASPGQMVKLGTTDAVLTVNYDHWNHTFSSVSGFYGYHFNSNVDTDGTSLSLLNVEAPERYHQFSQEFRVASKTDGPIEYLGGLYYQTDELHFDQNISYFFLTPVLQRIAPVAPYVPLGQTTDFSQSEHTYSAFASATWKVTDRLRLSAGARGSWTEKSYDWNLFYGTATQSFGGIAPLPAALQRIPAAFGLGTPGTLSGSRNDHSAMPSAKLQYQIDPDIMAYLSYARGFKAGGFNGTDNNVLGTAAQTIPFSPEHVNAYEAGLKSEWLDHKVMLNAAVFRSDYSDLQVSTNIATAAGTFVSLVRNAASSRSQGAELEAQWAVARNFRLSLDTTYLDSHYVSYPNVSPTALQQLNGIAVQDLSGRPTEFAPKWSGGLTGSYGVGLPGDYHLTLDLSAYFSTRYYLEPQDDALTQQGGYARLDGRLTFESPNRDWAVDLIGKNMTDRKILNFAINMPTALGSTLLETEQPANVALQFRYLW